MTVVSIRPGALELHDAAAFVSLSVATVERLVRERAFTSATRGRRGSRRDSPGHGGRTG